VLQCNEAHPRCANCIRLKITCTWPSSSRNGSPTSHSNGSEYDIPTHLHHPLGGSNASPTSTLAIDDLRLLHHWTTKVAFFHCSPSKSVVPLWSLDAIEIAFEHPFVLHGILAFSAIHKTIHEPLVDRTSLITQADAHISSALTVYMRLLHQSNMKNALPMFFMSGILFAYNLASAQIDEPQDPIGDFLHCLRLLRGVREVVGRYWHELAKSSIVHEMLSGVTNIEGIQVPNDVNGAYGSLVSLGEFAAKIDGEEGQVLVDTIGNLHRTFLKALVCRDEKHEHSIFMTWWVFTSVSYFNYTILDLFQGIAVLVERCLRLV
jgi:hypothetical protein